ncbi:hypothetical protein GG804_16615 [Sphingomonas histidinilytica]|jgi:hypothetical protein|uniref:5-deoxy-glucuronate isomerase n=1 Tax=Rhizorhabdus histidinilytica TaxID=439228 RepID=A0A1T5G230_9SPHN|nr:hypothetical protein [Rhizorhabdus histidinilytica]MBO9378393.1 hypothetical protein [Rhizorhabdus histidinilytica]QEH81526.1 hypothetical protein EIK56_26945 [Sphingomonas sp. C8-2]SKC02407.1 hypothetical protein SAMN06295920_111164 [Rhizorhabdus histidinilytica]
MYGRDDLRTTLAPARSGRVPTAFKKASYALFTGTEPQDASALSRDWYARGQTMIVAYSEAEAGAVFDRADQVDEYAVVLPDEGAELLIEIPEGGETVSGRAIAFVPGGRSRITVVKGGRLLRLFTTRSADLAAKCSNAAAYAEPDPNVAPYAAWPDPVGGRKVRVYSGNVAPQEGRFGRIYRGSTIMVNFGDGRVGPRSPDNLSPHHHDDFEQYSIALDGDYVHHLRWPWISDSTRWIDDDHERIAAPSVAVIPPPAIHTSQGMAPGLNRLLDVFCPPRRDFSLKPGWVLNADDYPMPADDQETGA